MKKLMLHAFLGLFLTQNSMAELMVNQGMSTKYYVKSIMNLHASVLDTAMNTVLRKYDCLEGRFSLRSTMSPVTRIFTNDDPGTVKVGYQTKCFNPELESVNFSIGVFGYDEDYTDLTIRLTTKSGVITKTFCAYGLHNELRKCPFEVEPKAYSTAIKTE